jgi:hypothetical protein
VGQLDVDQQLSDWKLGLGAYHETLNQFAELHGSQMFDYEKELEKGRAQLEERHRQLQLQYGDRLNHFGKTW